jgi:3-hydroxyacyl-[acyl-carrier-protein] dehydratase
VGGEARFLFVDRILAYEPGRWIRASHRLPAVPDLRAQPYRLLEALAQAAGWLIAASTGFTKRGLPLSIASVRLTDPVPADATVLLEAEIVAQRDESALIRGRASFEDRPVAEMPRGLCALIDADRLDDPARTEAMFSRLLARGRPLHPEATGPSDAGWPAGADLVGSERPDRDRARAIWNVGCAEWYFRDHFPRLSIMPGALQAQAMVELGMLALEPAGRGRPVLEGMREMKFRGFVRPGNRLLLEARALSITPEGAITTSEVLVEGKCVASIKEVHWAWKSACE